MKLKWLFLLFWGLGQFAYADPLDEALVIVYEQSAVVSTAQAMAGIVKGTSSVNS